MALANETKIGESGNRPGAGPLYTRIGSGPKHLFGLSPVKTNEFTNLRRGQWIAPFSFFGVVPKRIDGVLSKHKNQKVDLNIQTGYSNQSGRLVIATI
jgi:hypothetical protein